MNSQITLARIQPATFVSIILLWAFSITGIAEGGIEYRMVQNVKYDVSKPPFFTMVIPAGSVLMNPDTIHFTGEIKPIEVMLRPAPVTAVTPVIRIAHFPYDPKLFKKANPAYNSIVTAVPLNLRVFPLAHPTTNWNALGEKKITPHLNFVDYGLPLTSKVEKPMTSAQNEEIANKAALANVNPEQDAEQQYAHATLAGVYKWRPTKKFLKEHDWPGGDQTEVLDLHPDGTAFTYALFDNSKDQQSKKKWRWTADIQGSSGNSGYVIKVFAGYSIEDLYTVDHGDLLGSGQYVGATEGRWTREK
jgi:hypothetical protein